jgi:hypothetical protein
MAIIHTLFKSIAIALFLLTILIAIVDIDKENKGNYLVTLLFLAVIVIAI